MNSRAKRLLAYAMPIVAAVACTVSLAGCERKERVLDIEAPGVDIEVNKTKRGFEVESGRDKAVDIETPGVDIEVRRNKK
jgi:hypothetical protein